MKKILYVINSIKKNGPTNVLINMIKGINKEENIVYVVTILKENKFEILDMMKLQGVKVIELNYARKFGTIFKSKKINEIIEKEKINIVHTHGIIPTFMLRKAKCIKIATVHCCLYEDFKDTYGKIKGFFSNEFYVFSLKKFDKVICCSKSTYEIVRKRLPQCIYVVNGIDFEKEQNREEIKTRIRKELNIPLDGKVYIYVGALSYRKNVLRMLENYKKCLRNNEYLIVLGDGVLKNEVDKYNSSNIKILGFKENVGDYFSASDIYTSFSLSEGFSISIIEALSCNLLLLLSSIPSHVECFNISSDYYIGEYFDDGNFMNKKETVLLYKDQIKTSEFQEKYLSSKSMMQSYEKVYNELK